MAANLLLAPQSVAVSLKPKAQIARQILSYFVRNPQAADSLEGIARWRLLQERIHRTVQETGAALSWLVSEGYLREMSNPGAEPLYQLDATQTENAMVFLSEQEAVGVTTERPVRRRRLGLPRVSKLPDAVAAQSIGKRQWSPRPVSDRAELRAVSGKHEKILL